MIDGTSSFVSIVWSSLGIFLVFLLSPLFFTYTSQVFIFRSGCHSFSVSFEYILMFCFSIFTCCRSLFIGDSCLSSHSGFDLLTVIFRGTRFFHKLILLLYIVNRSTPWCYLSKYLSISRLLSRFRTWMSFSLCSWEKGYAFFFSDMILFMISTFFFSFWVNVCVCVFASVCLQCIGHCRVVLGLTFQVFLYLKSRLLY